VARVDGQRGDGVDDRQPVGATLDGGCNTDGTTPNSTPPLAMLGQETFISSAATPSRAERRAPHSTYSSNVSPKKLTTTCGPAARRKGIFFSASPSTPTFSRPIELIMPDAVSQIRGGRLPARGWSEIPLVQIAPSFARST
jgi:hypothetical protein